MHNDSQKLKQLQFISQTYKSIVKLAHDKLDQNGDIFMH